MATKKKAKKKITKKAGKKPAARKPKRHAKGRTETKKEWIGRNGVTNRAPVADPPPSGQATDDTPDPAPPGQAPKDPAPAAQTCGNGEDCRCSEPNRSGAASGTGG